MHKAHIRDIDRARQQGVIDDGEAAQLRETAAAVAAAIAVDDFAPEELTRHDAGQLQGDMSSPAQPKARPTAAE
jgi:acyl-CoA dehydrogenase